MEHYEEVLKLLHDQFDWKLTDSLTTTGKKLVADTIKALKIAENNQALQLQQTGVKSSVSIELKDWDYECADGCCTSFGTKLLLNGKELEHPNEEILDNSYVGCDVQTALHAVLKELGYEVTFV